MTRFRRIAVAAVGLALVVVGASLSESDPVRATDSAAGGAVTLIVIVALGLAAWKVRGRLDASAEATPVPWAANEEFARPPPERTARDERFSSETLAGLVEEAGARARAEGSVTAGIDVVRPPLREALIGALVQGEGGRSRRDVERSLAEGSWTDDPVAATVLDEAVEPPERSLRERLVAWLYPERTVRRLTRRAVQAVAEAADDALAPVPGQAAPRPVPVVRPRLEELRRGVDGRLQRAVDPAAVDPGSPPPEPSIERAPSADAPGRSAEPHEPSPDADRSEGIE